jgi:hypothetical protein
LALGFLVVRFLGCFENFKLHVGRLGKQRWVLTDEVSETISAKPPREGGSLGHFGHRDFRTPRQKIAKLILDLLYESRLSSPSPWRHLNNWNPLNSWHGHWERWNQISSDVRWGESR